MMSEYQSMICDLCSVSIGNVKKLVPEFFLKIKVCALLWKLTTFLENRIKTKKHELSIRIQSAAMVETIYWI